MNNIDYIKKYLPKEKWKESFERLEKNEPVQYIVGNVDFYGTLFEVNKNVLIPRFETELLVEKTIKYSNRYFVKPNILDIGTGSGCIAVTLKKEMLDSKVDAVDISEEALDVAKKNAISNSCNVSFKQSDVFSNVNKKYDIIISNPPYLSKSEEVMNIVKENEPHIALYAENNGFEIYERIFKEVKNYINERALLAFEIGYTQKEGLKKMCDLYFSDQRISFEKDLSGKDRFLFVFVNLNDDD